MGLYLIGTAVLLLFIARGQTQPTDNVLEDQVIDNVKEGIDSSGFLAEPTTQNGSAFEVNPISSSYQTPENATVADAEDRSISNTRHDAYTASSMTVTDGMVTSDQGTVEKQLLPDKTYVSNEVTVSKSSGPVQTSEHSTGVRITDNSSAAIFSQNLVSFSPQTSASVTMTPTPLINQSTSSSQEQKPKDFVQKVLGLFNSTWQTSKQQMRSTILLDHHDSPQKHISNANADEDLQNKPSSTKAYTDQQINEDDETKTESKQDFTMAIPFPAKNDTQQVDFNGLNSTKLSNKIDISERVGPLKEKSIQNAEPVITANDDPRNVSQNGQTAPNAAACSDQNTLLFTVLTVAVAMDSIVTAFSSSSSSPEVASGSLSSIAPSASVPLSQASASSLQHSAFKDAPISTIDENLVYGSADAITSEFQMLPLNEEKREAADELMGDDMDVAETMVFRPVFSYRQDSARRRLFRSLSDER